jgi:hypothetical protein
LQEQQTAALAFWWDKTLLHLNNSTEEYNGSTWTGGGNLGTVAKWKIWVLLVAGTQTSRISFWWSVLVTYGPPAPTDATEEYDGTFLDKWWKFSTLQEYQV